jgi:hypothetical protein
MSTAALENDPIIGWSLEMQQELVVHAVETLDALEEGINGSRFEDPVEPWWEWVVTDWQKGEGRLVLEMHRENYGVLVEGVLEDKRWDLTFRFYRLLN